MPTQFSHPILSPKWATKHSRLVLMVGYLWLCSNSVQATYRDQVYDPNIKTVQLYVRDEGFDQQLNLPVIAISQNSPLYLEFDEMGQDFNSYYLKIVHCDRNWNSSNLLDSEFIRDFINDFLITNYRQSIATRTQYVHYEVAIPKVKVSGNYAVLVYKDGQQDKPVFTKRFVVYDTKVTIKADAVASAGVEERFTHQQIDFNIYYGNYPFIFNPYEEIQVVLRQNGRWDNANYTIKPLFIKENERVLDYKHFNLENNFKGLNEFRFFDTRRIRNNSMNIEDINFNADIIKVKVLPDPIRSDKNYGFYFDANGRYNIASKELGALTVDPDYTHVTLELDTKHMLYGKIYVLGEFNHYTADEKSVLTYLPDQKKYSITLLLKQGYYNYLYGLKLTDSHAIEHDELEGSFFQTENIYEIMVYHKPMGARFDSVIGYHLLKFNAYSQENK